MYNNYQNRVMTARESINRIFADYNNKITEARLQNNATLAEIAFKAQQQRLELVLQQLTAKNQLLLDKSNKKLEIENNYYNRYQDVLKQINTENALAEQIRQFNESMALEREQFEWQKSNFKRSSGGGGYSGGGGSDDDDSYQPKKDPSATATDYYNRMVSSGANKSQVVGDINREVQAGNLTKAEAAELKQVFNPRGYTY
jgi:hypothetical protein